MIRLLFFLLLLLFSVTGLMANADNELVIYYYFNLSWQVKVYMLILFAFSAGIITAGILLLPDWINMKLAIREIKKENSALCKEMAQIRKSVTKVSSE